MKLESPFPKTQRRQHAILNALLQRGGVGSLQEVVSHLTEYFASELTPQTLALKENKRKKSSKWEHDIRNSKQSLVRAGYIFKPEDPASGIWKLTDTGRSRAKTLEQSGASAEKNAEIESFHSDSATQSEELLPSTTSGFNLSAVARRSIEQRGIKVARDHYISRGFEVEEKGKPYDLHCTKNTRVMLVEVKAAQGNAEQIILTKNEVELSKTRSADMQLAIVTNIILDVSGKASGGKLRIINPWLVDDRCLTPLAFEYDLSKHRE